MSNLWRRTEYHFKYYININWWQKKDRRKKRMDVIENGIRK